MQVSAAKASIQPTIDALNAAWNRADAEAFAAKCTSDVDFINLLGMYVKGRAAVASMHDKIYKGPYAGSTLHFSIENVRPVSPNAVLAIINGELQIPSGPVKGLVRTIATALFVCDQSEWYLANFQNTRKEATAANHTAIMIETFAKEA